MAGHRRDVDEDPEAKQSLLQEGDSSPSSTRAPTRRLPAVLLLVAALAAAACGARRFLLGDHQGVSAADAANVVRAVGTCTVTQVQAEHFCLPAKPIGGAMRLTGRNTPDACAVTAAADTSCGAFINYNPSYVDDSGQGGCHCVSVGSGNEACQQKRSMSGWAIYTAACTAEPPPAEVSEPSSPPVAAGPEPTAAAAAQPAAHPPAKLNPTLVAAGRCAHPQAEKLQSNVVCNPVKLMGEEMRTRGNTLEACAGAAAADAGCGSVINYNPSWEGVGACHCVDVRNLQCEQQQPSEGFMVYRLSCAQGEPASTPPPSPPPEPSTTPSTTAAPPATTRAPPPPSRSPVPPPPASLEVKRKPPAHKAPAALPVTDEDARRVLAPGGECDFKYEADDDHALCFCQRAGNHGCGSDCSCKPLGCDVIWKHSVTVTFPNVAKAKHCKNGKDKALLTIPKSYVGDLNQLHKKCGGSMLSILSMMLKDGFSTYQEQVAKGPVLQCIHAPGHITVPWLHLHTFGAGGEVDAMPLSPPTENSIAYCGEMKDLSEAGELSRHMVIWAGALSEEHATRKNISHSLAAEDAVP